MTIFNSDHLSHEPTQKELLGNWEGMLVSDSTLSPKSQIFYFNCEDGIIEMKYTFANMLSGQSDVSIKDRLLRFDDQTSLHDEIRMVTQNLAVGLWVTDWSSSDMMKPIIEDLRRYLPVKFSTSDIFVNNISLLERLRLSGMRWPRELGLSFLHVEENKELGTRIGLTYILKRLA